jgi:putative transposase
MRCCRYVELNPVKAGMVEKAEDYDWSSYKVKIGEQANDWLNYDPCYQGLDEPNNL